jgi:hypothetical protein
MASTAPAVSDNSTPAATKPLRVPPEETIWKRYSPHHELPLSGVSSFGLHALVIGFLIMAAALGFFGFSKSTRSLPVDPVRLALGGGGGNPNGEGNGPGAGGREENVPDKEGQPQKGTDEAPPRPELNPTEVTRLKEEFTDDAVRYIQSGPEAARVFGRMDKDLREKLSSGIRPGKGEGGPGKDGGKDSGKDTGEGSREGPGKANLSQREKRMLRWTLTFETADGMDYLRQLNALGAILAIPTGPKGDLKIVRNLLEHPAKLLDEDLSKIDRIYWIDDRPPSVLSLVHALGLRHQPDRIIAFMPQELEARMFKMELAYKGLTEDEIFETKFRVRRTGSGYEPYVAEQKPKGGKK